MAGMTPVPSVWPCLAYRDAPAALLFLVDAFGFTERAVHRDGDAIAHAELTWAAPDGALAGGVMFGSIDESNPDKQPFGNSSVHVLVADPDGLYRRATEAGATVVRELEDTDYGSRQFVVRDPEGNVWSFGTWYE